MELMVLRLMAWERAKGELKSMLQTHVDEMDKHKELKKTIEEFISKIENEGLHE
jgi:hypothetical protein